MDANQQKQPPRQLDFSAEGIRIVALDERRLLLFLSDRAVLFDELDVPDQPVEDLREIDQICREYCLPSMKKVGEDWPYFTRWLAFEKRSGLLVADFMLKTGLDSTGAVEIGYGVFGGHAGRGVMTRTMRCFLEWARLHSPIKRVKAEVERGNAASIRVLEKNGFRPFAPLVDTVWWERRL